MPCAIGLAVAAGSAARADPLPCQEDDTLSEAAAAFLLRRAPLESSQLLQTARAQGFDGVTVHAREGDDAALRAWLARLAQSAEGVVTCGEARTERRRLMLASVRGGRLWRVRADAGGEPSTLIHGLLEPGFGAPSLVVETQRDELVSLPVTIEQLRAGLALPAELAPRRVQLVAESASGPRPVAELQLVSTPGHLDIQVAPAAPGTAPHGERSVDGGAPPKLRDTDALQTQLAAFRRAQSVGALRPNRLLAQSAQGYAARVCELGRLAHRLEGEDPELRLRREHVAARGVGEVLARAESSDAALAALFASASHRLALLRREFTDVGIGQASDDQGRVCLVVLLASWPRRTP